MLKVQLGKQEGPRNIQHERLHSAKRLYPNLSPCRFLAYHSALIPSRTSLENHHELIDTQLHGRTLSRAVLNISLLFISIDSYRQAD